MKDQPRYLPSREQLLRAKGLGFIRHLILEPNLWHLNRRSASYACIVGSVCCFLPMPFQMVPAALLCLWIRCNLPVAIALVWISNPITMPPMFYFAYRVGAAILGQQDTGRQAELSLDYLLASMGELWQPLLLGCLVCGLVMGCTLFIAVRVYWRQKVLREWQRRRRRQQQLLDLFKASEAPTDARRGR